MSFCRVSLDKLDKHRSLQYKRRRVFSQWEKASICVNPLNYGIGRYVIMLEARERHDMHLTRLSYAYAVSNNLGYISLLLMDSII